MDENGVVLLTYSYTAWGKVTYSATNMESLALAVTLSKVNPFTYRGYCYDFDIDMYYLQSRYYDPEICRFINADSTDYLGATGTLLSYNLFAYCENDGVNFVDETGCAKKKDVVTIYRGVVEWQDPFAGDDDFVYNRKVKATIKDKKNWEMWGKLQKAASKIYPEGAAFYNYYRSNKGGVYFYDYQKAYKQDSKIEKAVNKVLKQLKTWASLFKNRNDEWFTISTSLTLVETISMNWMLALGGHYFGIVADVIYTTVFNMYIMKYWVIAIDRYNFDGNNKSFFGIKDSYNGRFVTLGWAKFFTSIGIMGGTTTWN